MLGVGVGVGWGGGPCLYIPTLTCKKTRPPTPPTHLPTHHHCFPPDCDTNCNIPDDGPTFEQQWDCRLMGLPDLNHSVPFVRTQLEEWTQWIVAQFRWLRSAALQHDVGSAVVLRRHTLMPADRQRHLAACVCDALDTGCSRPPMLLPTGTISPIGLSPTALAPSFPPHTARTCCD
jgi:hypothetical protein